ncbi:hypothetical protein KM043_000965 [Ampulex compressa]|nr:hypothetical protein KM043_000965 [Ampulex compressa]
MGDGSTLHPNRSTGPTASERRRREHRYGDGARDGESWGRVLYEDGDISIAPLAPSIGAPFAFPISSHLAPLAPRVRILATECRNPWTKLEDRWRKWRRRSAKLGPMSEHSRTFASRPFNEKEQERSSRNRDASAGGAARHGTVS